MSKLHPPAQAASLVLAGENPLAAAQVRGDAVDPDAIVRVANATALRPIRTQQCTAATKVLDFWRPRKRNRPGVRTRRRVNSGEGSRVEVQRNKIRTHTREEEAEVYRNCGVTRSARPFLFARTRWNGKHFDFCQNRQMCRRNFCYRFLIVNKRRTANTFWQGRRRPPPNTGGPRVPQDPFDLS